MFRNILFKTILVALGAAGCYGLIRMLGVGVGLAVWAGGMGLACAAVAGLLRTAQVDEITWKNRLAGYLLPWGYGLAGGRLAWIVVASWTGWALIGAGVAILHGRDLSGPVDPAPATTGDAWRWVLFGVWAVNASVLVYLLGTVLKSFAPGSGSGRALIKPMAVVAGVTVASAVLHFTGHTIPAVLIGAAPVALVGLVMAAFAGLILFLSAIGKPVRWN